MISVLIVEGAELLETNAEDRKAHHKARYAELGKRSDDLSSRAKDLMQRGQMTPATQKTLHKRMWGAVTAAKKHLKRAK